MSNQLIVKMVLDAWYSKIKDADKVLDMLSDEQLMHEISPGRNRGIYLLGHLTAVHDRLVPLLDLGERLYPDLDEPFLTQPDKTVANLPSASILRQEWKNTNEILAHHFNSMEPDDFFRKHNAVSVEAFEKEPHRNRLNVIISRTNHLASHVGQLILI